MEQQVGGDHSSQGNIPTNKWESSDPPPIYPEKELPSHPPTFVPSWWGQQLIASLESDGQKISPNTSGTTAESSQPTIIGSARSNIISSNFYYRRGKFWSKFTVLCLAKPRQYYRRGRFWPVWCEQRIHPLWMKKNNTFMFAQLMQPGIMAREINVLIYFVTGFYFSENIFIDFTSLLSLNGCWCSDLTSLSPFFPGPPCTWVLVYVTEWIYQLDTNWWCQ